MPSTVIAFPMLLQAAAPSPAWSAPADARGLVLLVHPHAAGRHHAGYAFVADVLHANGFATLPLCMLTPAEEAANARLPGLLQSRQRLRAVFDWLAQQPAAGGWPVALIGLGDAVGGCVAAAAHHGALPVQSLVLLDGRADRFAHHLARLRVPTLFVLGCCDLRRQARLRVAMRDMTAARRLEVLQLATLPQPLPGALEAFACTVLEWLDQTLVPRRLSPAGSQVGGCGGWPGDTLPPSAEPRPARRPAQNDLRPRP
jgi:putative phosphoribosyl transferase